MIVYLMKQSKIFFIALFLLPLSVSFSDAAFFSDSFESSDFTHTENGVAWTGQVRATVSTDRAHTGTHSAKFHYPGGAIGSDAWAELRFYFGSPRTEVYLQFYIWFPAYYVVRMDLPNNNKLFYMWGNTYTDNVMSGMEFSRASESVSPHFSMKAKKVGEYTLSCAGATGAIGETFLFDNSYLGRWVKFQFHDKLDSGAGDGVFQMWVDDVLKINNTGLSWVGAPCPPGYWLNGYLMGWANSGYDQDTDIYIDDVVFSDSYIGPSQLQRIPSPVRTITVTP